MEIEKADIKALPLGERNLFLLVCSITPVDEIKGTTLVAIAVYIGKTRLIDNFIA